MFFFYLLARYRRWYIFFFQAEDGIRDKLVTGVQTCALPISNYSAYYRLPLSGVNGPLRQTEYTLADFGYDEATRRFRPPPSSGANELLFFASRSFSDTGQQLQSRTLTPNPLPPTGGLQLDDEIVNRTLNPNEDAGA